MSRGVGDWEGLRSRIHSKQAMRPLQVGLSCKKLCSGQAHGCLWGNSRLCCCSLNKGLILRQPAAERIHNKFNVRKMDTWCVCIAQDLHTNCRPQEGATMYSPLASHALQELSRSRVHSVYVIFENIKKQTKFQLNNFEISSKNFIFQFFLWKSKFRTENVSEVA